MKGGLKYDNEKPPYDLIPKEALEEIAKVLGFGARKYARHNWRQGLNFSRLIAASLRHITQFGAGEDNDSESGLSHIGHALCCLSFLQTFISQGKKDLDDRYHPSQTPEVVEDSNTYTITDVSGMSDNTNMTIGTVQPSQNTFVNSHYQALQDRMLYRGETNVCSCGNKDCKGSGAV